jgi:hypothetical protein
MPTRRLVRSQVLFLHCLIYYFISVLLPLHLINMTRCPFSFARRFGLVALSLARIVGPWVTCHARRVMI